jgi:hypothetical protein
MIELSEKIAIKTINDVPNLALERLSIGAPCVDQTMSGE